MHKKRLIALIIVPLIALTGYGSTAAYNSAVDRSLDDAGLSADFSHWTPTPSEVRVELDAFHTEKERRARFAALFTQRFRRHEPPMAVGLRFLEDDRVKLMYPARMEPWNMDRLALAVWKEMKDDFGHSFDIDLYITFIGAAPIKIGELRPMAVNPSCAQINHHPAVMPLRQADLEYQTILPFSDPLRPNFRALMDRRGR